jgi:hypothetical protein
MKTTPYAYATSAPVQSQVVIPQERPVMRVATSAFSLDPEYTEMINIYTANLNAKVIDRFIDDSQLLASVYELLGMIPSEIADIQKRCRDGNARLALFEVDDLVEKLILWRIKLSKKHAAKP